MKTRYKSERLQTGPSPAWCNKKSNMDRYNSDWIETSFRSLPIIPCADTGYSFQGDVISARKQNLSRNLEPGSGSQDPRARRQDSRARSRNLGSGIQEPGAGSRDPRADFGCVSHLVTFPPK